MVANMSRMSWWSSSLNSPTGLVLACITGAPHRMMGSTRPAVLRSPTARSEVGFTSQRYRRAGCDPEWRLVPDSPQVKGWDMASTDEHAGAAALVGGDQDYLRNLRLNRDFSSHTVRAYAGDVAGFLVHLQRLGATTLDDASLQSVRSWLAKQASLGLARATLQRRAAAVRMFCRWAQQEGHASGNPAAKLRSPRTVRTLPLTLEPPEAAEMLAAALAVAGESGGPAALRDAAILELLYATGIRVSELVGLDIDDLDRDRGIVRVFGKGRDR